MIILFPSLMIFVKYLCFTALLLENHPDMRPIYLVDNFAQSCFVVCEFGYYGIGCQHECSVFCKYSRKCNHISGICDEGCKLGWHGNYCLERKLFNY